MCCYYFFLHLPVYLCAFFKFTILLNIHIMFNGQNNIVSNYDVNSVSMLNVSSNSRRWNKKESQSCLDSLKNLHLQVSCRHARTVWSSLESVKSYRTAYTLSNCLCLNTKNYDASIFRMLSSDFYRLWTNM